MRVRHLMAVVLMALTAPAIAQDTGTDFPMDGSRIILPSPIVFEAGDDTLAQDASIPALVYLGEFLAAKPAMTRVRIEFHSDHYPDAATNQALTEARAQRLGAIFKAVDFACDRLVFAAFGATKPVVAAGQAGNDRIEIHGAELRGHAIGGLPLDGGGRDMGTVCVAAE